MKRLGTYALAAALALPATAFAVESTDSGTYDQSDVYRSKPGGGVGIQVDAGVNAFDRSSATDFLDTGIGYGAGLELRPQRNVGVEINYQGAVNNLKSGISTDGSIVTNQVGGDLRLNAVPPTYQLPANLTPFVFGGAEYSRFDTHNFTPGFSSANAFSLPVGAGLEADVGKFLIGARFTYNFNLNNARILPGAGGVDNWLVTGNIGARFGS